MQDSLTPLQGAGVTAISPGWPNPALSMVPASLDGTVCWQQHQQVFNAIAKSNGWDDETAALQLWKGRRLMWYS